jgi:hypothetical protein
MHNPSKADATESDRTIDKIIRFSKAWGYGGIYVGNLFPYRSTDPKELKRVGNDKALHADNWQYLREMAEECEIKMLAHGNPVFELPAMRTFYSDWHYLKLTNKGNPYHPLYLKEDLMPKKLLTQLNPKNQ